jgi:hypothetical protein
LRSIFESNRNSSTLKLLSESPLESLELLTDLPDEFTSFKWVKSHAEDLNQALIFLLYQMKIRRIPGNFSNRIEILRSFDFTKLSQSQKAAIDRMIPEFPMEYAEFEDLFHFVSNVRFYSKNLIEFSWKCIKFRDPVQFMHKCFSNLSLIDRSFDSFVSISSFEPFAESIRLFCEAVANSKVQLARREFLRLFDLLKLKWKNESWSKRLMEFFVETFALEDLNEISSVVRISRDFIAPQKTASILQT